MKKVILIFSVFISLFFFISCQQKDEVIKIGALLSLTGNNSVQGNLAKNGILLGADYVNQNGGINGKKIEIIIEDTQTSTKGTLNAFMKLTSVNKVAAILTTGDTEFQAINALAEENAVPVMATICTGMLDEGRSKWLFRYCYNEDQEDAYLMDFAKKDLNIKTMALAYPNTLFGQEFFKYSEKYILQNQIDLISTIAYDFNSTDQRANALKIMNTNPDAICARGFGNALDALLRHVAELGYKGPILGDLSLSLPSTIHNTGGIMEGAYIVASDLDVTSENELIKEYQKLYKEKYNLEPVFWDAIGFDSFMYIVEAIKKEGEDAKSIQKALYEIESVNLLLGDNVFNNKNDVSFEMHMFQLNDGNLKRIK